MTGSIVTDAALDLLFREARTYRHWHDKPVSPILLEAVYDLAKMGPTSGNCSPMRVVFVVGPEAKARLRPCLSSGNVEQTMAAPATAIIAHDMDFPDLMPRLYRKEDARPWFAGKPDLIAETAFRNGSLQGAYLIMAARALGLDCGPMSGFNRAKTDKAFFEGQSWRSNFLVNLGYGLDDTVDPRDERLDFDEACRIE